MIKHVHFVRKRLADGGSRWYVYAWRGGPPVMWADGPKKPKLSSEALKLLANANTPPPVVATPPTTLGDLIQKWQASPIWTAYAASTKKTWSTYVRAIERRWGKVPLAVFNDSRMREKIVDWQEENADRPRAADLGIDALERLLAYGIRRGGLSFNAAAGIGSIYGGGQREEIIWLEAELDAFEIKATELGMETAALALRLCAVTGLRRQDLVTLTWVQVKQFAIVKKALKKSKGKRRFATVPRVPELDSVLKKLAQLPRNKRVQTVLVVNGRPWKLDELTRAVATIRDAMGGVYHTDEDSGQRRSKHLHDARGTYATKLMILGLSDDEIADVMGWSRDQVARIRAVYVDRTTYHVALGRRIAGKL